MFRIVVVRHGQTKWNIGQVFRGRADVPLNQTGKLQAKSLAKALADFKISAIYSSSLSRAKETAQAIAQEQNLKIKISDLLLDISYGKWQGLSHDKVATKWPRLYQLWHETPHKVKFPGGESLSDIRKRAKKFLKEAVSQHQEETIVAVSHRVTIKVLLCTALGISNSYFWQFVQNTASFSILDYEKGTFSLFSLNETDHLKKIKGGLDKVDF